MTVTQSEIRGGAYFDSVVLMLLQRGLSELPGVEDAGVVMATAANLALLQDSNLLTEEGKKANPDDLLIVVKAKDDDSALAALSQFDNLIKNRKTSASHDFFPRSLESAIKQIPNANWVLISVPGRYAASIADDALEKGKNVFLYSDNVSIDDELKLKNKAQNLGLIVMGPDCGTAIINGIGLGFANRVRKGKIGIVGASGTGLQAISSYIHNYGAGISQAIGTGGRDLKEKINGITAMQGLSFLQNDPNTKVIVLVSKPPSDKVAIRILTAAENINKPVVINFIGYPPPSRKLNNLHFVSSLEEAAEKSISLLNENNHIMKESTENNPPLRGYLRGLFSGGTLAYEALLGFQTFLSPIYSNVPFKKDQLLVNPLQSEAHSIIDLGEDIFTVGKLHPMMDNDLRIRRFEKEVGDKETAVILLDVVLGEGAHLDPSSELAPAIKKALKSRPELSIVALVIGTDEDPQDIQKQIDQLETAGAKVFTSSQKTIEYINSQLTENGSINHSYKIIKSLNQPFSAINIGLLSFYESLKSQEAEAVHVDWRPPAGGNENLMSILGKMRS